MNRRCLITIVMLAITGSAGAADRWLNWRGPNMDGSVDAKGLPLNWSEDKNVIWKAPMPHWAGSSPIVVDGRIYLTAPVRDAGESKSDDKGKRLPGYPTKSDDEGGKHINLICYDANDGKELWQRNISIGNKFLAKHNLASPSPVSDGTYIIAASGSGVVICCDRDGKEQWKYDLQQQHGEFGIYWGYASSPMVYRDTVILQVLQGSSTDNPSFLIALDIKTGERRWYQERKTDATKECPDAYTTPVILQHDGKDQLIISGADWVTAHDPETGKEIWRAKGLNPEKIGNFRICGTPVPMDNGLVVATSREHPIIAVRAGGKGDVTDTHTVWTLDDKRGPDVPSAATDGKYLYLVNDKGIAMCVDGKTGEKVWGPERLLSGPISASPLVANGRVYITNEDCETVVFATGPEYKELATNKLDGGYTLSSWAVSGKRMYLRAGKFLYCLGKL